MRLLMLLVLTTATVFINNLVFISAFLATLLVLTYLTPAKTKLKSRLFPLLLICSLVIIFQLLFNTTQNIATRLYQGTTGALKILTLSLLVFIYTTTTSINQIVKDLGFLPKSIQTMLTITLSLIPAIFEEAKKILVVQKSRGYNRKTLFPLIIPLLHRTLKRAERVALIMDSKGF